jgi:hypothetical protein
MAISCFQYDFDVSKVAIINPTKRALAFRQWMKKLMSGNRKLFAPRRLNPEWGNPTNKKNSISNT